MDATGAFNAPLASLIPGTTYHFRAKAVGDGTDFGVDMTFTTNIPPTQPVVQISPDPPVTTDDLVCNITTVSTDPDGGTVTYTYEWYKDDVLQPDQTTVATALSDTLSSALTAKGEVWKCVVTPNDGTVDGPSADDQVTIGNTAPAAPVVEVTPVLPLTGDNLQCTIVTESSDLDYDIVTYTYAWYRNNVLRSGLIGTTVASSYTAGGQVWKCVVTPNDGTVDGPTGEAQVTIGNSPPNAPSNPSPAYGGVDVSITADLSWMGGDPDTGDTVTYTVYFGASTSPPEVRSGQTGRTYNPGTLSYDTQYYWRILARDNHGEFSGGTLWHFTTGTTANNPPNMPSNPSPTNGQADVSITADLSWMGGDPDAGDTVTYMVYFGTFSSPPPRTISHTTTTYDPGKLGYDTHYYWRVAATDSRWESTVGPLWEFTTEAGPQPTPTPTPTPSPTPTPTPGGGGDGSQPGPTPEPTPTLGEGGDGPQPGPTQEPAPTPDPASAPTSTPGPTPTGTPSPEPFVENIAERISPDGGEARIDGGNSELPALSSSPATTNWSLVGGIIATVVAIGLGLAYSLNRRRLARQAASGAAPIGGADSRAAEAGGVGQENQASKRGRAGSRAEEQ
jgi:hypothetical protein